MDYAQESLESHNYYRGLHGVPPLALNGDLTKRSQAYANALAKKNKLEHSEDNPNGENLYYFMSSDPNLVHKAEEAVKSWYDEIRFHDFKSEKANPKSGHFTQVIWRETREMGAAFAKKDGKWYIVANYSPAGNVIGEYVKNVPPIGGEKKQKEQKEEAQKKQLLAIEDKKKPAEEKKQTVEDRRQGGDEERQAPKKNENKQVALRKEERREEPEVKKKKEEEKRKEAKKEEKRKKNMLSVVLVGIKRCCCVSK